MDEFEYRLEISDRDWECFFTECEGCNLLPPSLARMDDSGMSDFDDHFHGPRAQKVDPAPGTPVNDRPVNGPPNYSGSPPVEQWFGTHQNSEFDSVLSGSEEDIHLQSVNIFFERLKDLRVPEPDQERVEDNKEKQEEQQIRGRSLPKSCPNLNTPPDGVEEVFGKETQRPVDPIWNINTMKISGAESNFFSEPETCSTSPLSFCKSPETDLYITEGDFTDSILDEEEQENPLHDLKESLVASDTRPQLCRLEMWRSMDNIKQVDLLMNPETLCKKCSSRKDQISSPEGSQLVSLRRKRRRKRRLSLEAGEGGHPCERQSREEHLTVKEGRRLFVSTEMLDLKEHKNLTYVLTPNPATIKFPDNFSAQEIKISLSLSVSPVDNQCQPLQQRKCTDGNCLTNHTSKQPLSLGDDNDNDAAGFQSNGEFKVSESSSVDKSPSLAVSSAEMDTEKSKSQRHEVKPSAFKPSDERNVSVSDCKNEKYANHSTAEIKLISPLPSAESCANVMEILQTRKLSTAKSDLAAEAGNSGPGKHTQCPSNAEGQEQLESDSTNTNQSVIAVKETHLSVNTPGGLTSQPKAFQDKTLDEVISTYSTSEDINMLPNKSSISGNTSDLDTGQQTCPPEYLTSFCFSAKHKKEETLSMLNSITNTMLETEAPKTEDVQMSPFDITPMSFHNTLDIESVLPPSSENISLGFCSSIRDYESAQEGNEMQTLLATGEVKSESSVPKREDEIQSDFPSKLEGVINASIDVDEPEKIPNSVVVMSSFWREMEKLTINDILGLRNAGKSTLPDALPALNECEETGADSGIYTEEDEPKTEEAMGEMCKVASSSSRTVTWQSEPVLINQIPDIGHGRTVLESDTDSSQRVLTERAQNYLKKISKTLSVHNLPALESGLCSYTSKGDALEIFEEQETKSLTYFAGSDSAKKDTTLPSSSTNSYRISFSDIFQYFFGGKQLVSRQSTKVDTTTLCSSGSSVPETYDQFFSEFDNDGFFNPLITTKEKNKDKPVPIFSYSRSTSRSFQFPEAYEHFFALSSSDDSSSESDEEESCRPVRVVSRFSRKVSSTQITTDVYDNFFTDRDITENLFSLSLLSFRKLSFTAPAAQEEGANLLEPVRQRSRHQIQKMGFPVNALGSPAVMYPDPLLFHLEERISSQLAVQPCRYKGLDMAISDPRLDAPLLPLKQSDMCLVCIAFASWVLKTANSQADDAWKAVLLANVSALSAIRYLRKYVKVEAVTREMKSSYPALTES